MTQGTDCWDFTFAQLQLTGTISAGIGGVAVEPTHPLQPDDELQLFRQLGGG